MQETNTTCQNQHKTDLNSHASMNLERVTQKNATVWGLHPHIILSLYLSSNSQNVSKFNLVNAENLIQTEY